MTRPSTNDELLRLALDGAELGTWDYNPVTDDVYWDSRTRELFGVGPEEEIRYDRVVWDVVHPEDRPRVHAVAQHAFDPAGDGLYQVEHRVIHRDGSMRWLAVRGRAFFEGAGDERRAVRLLGTVQDVTERKRAEAAVVEWKDRYESAVRASGQLLYDWDPATNEIFYGGDVERFLGYTPDEVAGGLDRWLELVHPKDRDSFRREIEQVNAEGRPFHLVFRIFRKDGRVMYCEDRGHFVHDDQGVPVRMSGFVTDVTARVRADQALRESEERATRRLDELEGIYRHAPIGLCVLDTDLRWVRINEHMAGINGFPVEEHIGRRPHELVPDLSGVEPLLRRVLETGEPVTGIELTGMTPAKPGVIGSWVESWLPLTDSDGNIVGVNIVAEEVTERKQAEQALRESEARLRDAERMTRFLADVSVELAALTDYASTLRKVVGIAVPTFADWCGVHLVDDDGVLRPLVAGNADPEKVRLIHESWSRPARAGAPQHILEILQTGNSQLVEDVSESLREAIAYNEEHLQAMRELGMLSYICVPLQSRGKALGLLTFATAESGRRFNPEHLLIAEDLGRRAAVAIDNAGLYQELRQADRRKDEFLATLAHELRNPLAPLRNGLSILKLVGDGNRQVTGQTLAMMDRQLAQMVRLIDDLLDVSRITRGKLELRKEPVELAAVLHNAVESTRPLIESLGHEIAVTLPAQPLLLEADSTRLAQLFSNLLNNAAKYTERGGRIWLTAERLGDEAVVRVRDTGIGIPREKLLDIFEMFEQVDPSLDRSRGGLGIGLTLVKRLVELHGGRVEAHSDGLGQGTELVVRLPLLNLLAGPPEPERAAVA
jgi:PAS domain S-box-containing protein